MARLLAAAGMLSMAACAASGGPRASSDRLAAVPVTTLAGQPSLRGLHAFSRQRVWASGSGGTVARSADGGRSWEDAAPAADDPPLDFRDLEVLAPGQIVLMSAGPGEASRLLRTGDGGVRWREVHRNRHPQGFYDGLAFWDARRGLLVGDPTDGALTVLRTGDGGRTWTRIPPRELPAAAEGEYCFAASGTSVAVQPGGLAWIGTGGTRSRVLRSVDGGATWTSAEAPLATGEGAGVFSLAFADARRGVAVGGDYLEPGRRAGTAAWTDDGGRSWHPAAEPPGGYRSGAAWVAELEAWIAVGPNGVDLSTDGGRRWRPLDGAEAELRGFHAVSGQWLAGAGGRIGVLEPRVEAATGRQSRTAPITP